VAERSQGEERITGGLDAVEGGYSPLTQDSILEQYLD